MGFFDYFFAKKIADTSPKIQFGRFSDAYKDEIKYDAWDRALEEYENEEYLASYKSFFTYLKDESAGNVSFEEKEGKLHFEFYQGSKKIVGVADTNKITAEAKIAKTEKLHIGFLRRLLEENYQMRYSRYALDRENNLTAVFTSHIIDGSPYKLYYGLKELATYADKKDDILISEFDTLQPINNGHVRQVDENEKQIKFDYKNNEIKKAFDLIDTSKLNLDHYPGAESYIYLDLIYRLDYLLKPEGNTMEIIDNIHNLYFQNKEKSPDQKNRIIRKELRHIEDISYALFSREIYDVKSTFGITQTSGLERIQEFIDSEIKKMDWYYQNGHTEFALAIPSYIVGYSLFNYSMPAPMRDLFNLFYQIMEYSFFAQLGINGTYRTHNEVNVSKIKKAIKSILSEHDDEYPHMKVSTRNLSFEDMCEFNRTFLEMIRDINFQRKDMR
ncbi:MAG: hypothetical protein AAGA77_06100 [Bacteroidota bacterium]